MSIYRYIEDMPITELVAVSPVMITETMCRGKHCVVMDDARSAAFFAMGEAIRQNEKVAVIVEGMYLTDMYTAITEAWFQKAGMIIFAIYDNINDIKTAWLDRCIDRTITCMEKELDKYSNEIYGEQSSNLTLVNLVREQEEKTVIDYEGILEQLSQVCGKDRQVICYNADANMDTHGLDIQNIDIRNKYGVLSKYIGAAAVGSDAILCCTTECVVVDVNIFRTRYKSNNMKIIIYDTMDRIHKKGIDTWIESNDWRCIRTVTDDTKAYEEFMTCDEGCVLILKGGK